MRILYVVDTHIHADHVSAGRTLAQAAGAVVRSEKMQGKGNVVRRMFADVEADTEGVTPVAGDVDDGAVDETADDPPPGDEPGSDPDAEA